MNKPLAIYFLLICITGVSCVMEGPSQGEKKIIQTDKAPQAIGIYSQAVQSGNTLYLSGQLGLIPETRKLAGDDISSQAHQALKNITSILEKAGYTLRDVVKTQVYLSDLNDYQTFNEVYVQYFQMEPPARAVVEVSRIPLDAKIEIMITAVKN